MTNKIFIGVALIIKDDSSLVIETCLCREKDREAAEAGLKTHFLGFIAKHNIEYQEILTFVQEKDKHELQTIINDSISVKESFARIIRSEIRGAMADNAEIVVEKYAN